MRFSASLIELTEVLKAPSYGNFDEVSVLVNESFQTIRQEISHFFANKKTEDLLLFYFLGYSIQDEQDQLYLTMRDTELDRFSSTGIPARFVTEEMDNSGSKRQVLILDCSFIKASNEEPLGIRVNIEAAFKSNGSRRVIISATDLFEYTWKDNRISNDAESSFFTFFLIQGLKTGEASPSTDLVNIDAMYDYVYNRVVETSNKIPCKFSYGERNNIIISRNPHRVSMPSEPRSEQQVETYRESVEDETVTQFEVEDTLTTIPEEGEALSFEQVSLVGGDGSDIHLKDLTGLAKTIVSEGMKYVAEGYSPILLKRGLEKAISIASETIEDISVELTTREEVVNLVNSAIGSTGVNRGTG